MGDIYIVLQNKMIFKGKSFGAEGEAIGELVFSSGMGGYIESLTDPAFFGQILMQTFPLIGNYGMIEEDFEREQSFVKAYVVREHCEKPSNFRCDMTLDNYLKKQGIVGVFNIDTRELTKILREQGVMNAKITRDISNIDYKEIEDYKIVDALSAVSENRTYTHNKGAGRKIALIDYGSKANIINELVKRDCEVTLYPHNTSAEEILAMKPKGIVLSNGPGNPADHVFEISVLEKLMGRLPILGFGLGHQLMALSLGGKTEKMKQGHRGQNQPVKCRKTGRIYTTNQNHGYVVDAASVEGGTESYYNANDNTNEGMEYVDKQAFSVQFYPDSAHSPAFINQIFDSFIKKIEENS